MMNLQHQIISGKIYKKKKGKDKIFYSGSNKQKKLK